METKKQIENFVLELEINSPFVARLRRRLFRSNKALPTEDRLVLSLKKPSVGNPVKTYVRGGQSSRSLLYSSSLCGAFCNRIYGRELGALDPARFEAPALGHRSNRVVLAQIKGFSCDGLTYDKVAQLLRLPRELAPASTL